ncbi:MAG: endolytic transglycosylase MltG [Oscillospiraceae bacterium]|nr:endolytic transglycosylase MltG [Oscillospiraceae bacterium]
MANNDYDFEFEEQDTDSASKMKSKKPQNRFVRFLLTLFWCMVMVAASLFLAYFALSSASDLLGINQVDEQIEITIPEDAKGSISKVSKILSDTGVIDQPLTFQLYAKLRHMDGSDRGEGKAPRLFLPGTYVVNSRWGYDNLMNYLSYERTEESQLDVVTVTISEGMTVVQIAQKLEENKVCSAEDFYEALNGEFDYAFLERIPEDERFRKLEGYLFPDTYEFFVDMNPTNVVKKFLANYTNRVNDEFLLTIRDLPNGLAELDNLMTLASIIQKEAASYEEMCRVSAVFHNRLDDSANYPFLQSDATDGYIEDSIRPFMTVEDQGLYDAYDSYKCIGLPIGPICNPGLDAIRAAANPDPSIDGYFFVSDDAGTYYYASTVAEHEANIAKANAVNKTLED